MLKHMLMNPAFPDLVADWAEIDEDEPAIVGSADDNREPAVADRLDPLTALGKVEIASTRLW